MRCGTGRPFRAADLARPPMQYTVVYASPAFSRDVDQPDSMCHLQQVRSDRIRSRIQSGRGTRLFLPRLQREVQSHTFFVGDQPHPVVLDPHRFRPSVSGATIPVTDPSETAGVQRITVLAEADRNTVLWQNRDRISLGEYVVDPAAVDATRKLWSNADRRDEDPRKRRPRPIQRVRRGNGG